MRQGLPENTEVNYTPHFVALWCTGVPDITMFSFKILSPVFSFHPHLTWLLHLPFQGPAFPLFHSLPPHTTTQTTCLDKYNMPSGLFHVTEATSRVQGIGIGIGAVEELNVT